MRGGVTALPAQTEAVRGFCHGRRLGSTVTNPIGETCTTCLSTVMITRHQFSIALLKASRDARVSTLNLVSRSTIAIRLT